VKEGGHVRYLRNFSLLIAVAAAIAALAGSASASGDVPVVVFNTGNSTVSCGVGGYGGDYSGFATTTIIKNGDITLQNCYATLVSGTPVSRTVVLQLNGCTWVFVPAGVVAATCPR
jgi:hypothetical protein